MTSEAKPIMQGLDLAKLVGGAAVVGKRVLVCGGRDYTDRDHIQNTLNELNSKRGPFAVVIHGCATGADSEANEWALAMPDVKISPYGSDWRRFGRSAGPRRNQRMIDEGRPDLVVAFPGGRGTADMVRRAKAAGLEVIHVKARVLT